MSNENWKAYLSGLCMSIIFGLTFLFTKMALAVFSPMVLLAYRFSIAAVVLTILVIFKVLKVNYKNKPIKGLIALSIFYPVISFVFETLGVKYVSISQAGIMVSLMPIFVMILGIIILKEVPTNIQKIFIAASITGVIFTIIFAKGSEKNSNVIGMVLLLISVMSGSMNNVLSRKYSKYFTPLEITFVMIWIGSIFFVTVALIQGILKHDLYNMIIAPIFETESVIAVLYLGILASVIAFFAMNYMLANLPAVNVSIFNNLATLISILSGVLIAHETLYWYQIIGGILIISSVIGINYQKQ